MKSGILRGPIFRDAKLILYIVCQIKRPQCERAQRGGGHACHVSHVGLGNIISATFRAASVDAIRARSEAKCGSEQEHIWRTDTCDGPRRDEPGSILSQRIATFGAIPESFHVWTRGPNHLACARTLAIFRLGRLKWKASSHRVLQEGHHSGWGVCRAAGLVHFCCKDQQTSVHGIMVVMGAWGS
jgi:hypothetical protein